MVRITVLCFDNVLMSSVAAFVDAFKIANQLWQQTQGKTKPLFSWQLASRNGRGVITSSGLNLGVDGKLPEKTDLIFIPAWHFDTADRLVEESNKIALWSGQWMVQQYKSKALITAGCSGTFILAATGILSKRTITTSWWLGDYFRMYYPDVSIEPSQLIVEDGRIFTTGPVNAHFNLAMKLIEKIGGYPLALLCAKTMLVDINRPSQVAYEVLPVQNNHADEGIMLAQEWMLKNVRKSFDMSDAARAARMSQRTFIRRFKRAVGVGPLEYMQGIRIDLAKRLLETSDLTLDQILSRIGYADASAFRRLFKQRTSVSPAEYRKRFTQHG